MKKHAQIGFILAFSLSFLARAEDVYWRVDPGVKECSIDPGPELTQGEFRKITREAGLVAVFKSLSSAETLGEGTFNLTLERSSTAIDQHDPAWINTFVHPGPGCPLGDAIQIPALRARYGLSKKTDVGVLFTAAPRANYGFIAGEVKHQVLEESEYGVAGAIRPTVTRMIRTPGMEMDLLSVDASVSKKFALGGSFTLSPYLGARENLVYAKEKVDRVSLASERVWSTQGIVGVAAGISSFRLTTEYDAGPVSTLSFGIGYDF